MRCIFTRRLQHKARVNVLQSIVYFVLGQTDPHKQRAPSWRLIPAATETDVEGRNKTLYCLAVGR